MRIYRVRGDQAELRCRKCGSSWFSVTGFAVATLYYDAEDRAFLDLVDIVEDKPLHPTDVHCMDCGANAITVVGDVFGPMHTQEGSHE